MEVGHYCPLLKKNCIEHKCAWYIHVRGSNPNTGEDLDNCACSISWLPILTIENAQQSRQTGAAVESFRNEVIRSNEVNRELYLNEISKNFGIIPTVVTPITNFLSDDSVGEKENEN